jgi:hypothetical protein
LELNHRLGWRLLYCPSEVRLRARVATLGLNPGGGRDRAPQWDSERRFSNENGNSYFVESWGKNGGKSSLQMQIARLNTILDIPQQDLLSGNLVPFRSPDWKSLQETERSLNFGLTMLDWLLASTELRLVVAFGLGIVERRLVRHLGAESVGEEKTGWGKIVARFYRTPRFHLVLLPHLSRFSVLGRPQSASLEARLIALLG